MSSERNDELPFLPGNGFKDYKQKRYHLSNTLNFKNGYPMPNKPKYGIGGTKLPQSDTAVLLKMNEDTTLQIHDESSKRMDAGVETSFCPGHLAFDKKVLKFDAYFKEAVHESPNEYYRVRPVQITTI